MARLLSVNVGLPREVQWNDKTVRTAVWKLPARWVAKRGVLAENVHTEVFGALEGITPGLERVDHTPHLHKGHRGPALKCHLRVAGSLSPGTLDSTACLSWLSLAKCFGQMVVPDRGGHTCMTGLIGGQLLINPNRSRGPLLGTSGVLL